MLRRESRVWAEGLGVTGLRFNETRLAELPIISLADQSPQPLPLPLGVELEALGSALEGIVGYRGSPGIAPGAGRLSGYNAINLLRILMGLDLLVLEEWTSVPARKNGDQRVETRNLP